MFQSFLHEPETSVSGSLTLLKIGIFQATYRAGFRIGRLQGNSNWELYRFCGQKRPLRAGVTSVSRLKDAGPHETMGKQYAAKRPEQYAA